MLNWIIVGFFLATISWHVIRAICKPMVKNILTLICIPVALLITSVLHKFGLFKWIAEEILKKVNIDEKVNELINKFLPLISALLAPTLFVLTFNIVFWLLKVLHVNLVTKYLKNRNVKREKKELKEAIKVERKRLEETIRENEERNRALLDSLPQEQQDAIISQYQPYDEDEIEDMVDERIKEEKKRRKKHGSYKESVDNKLISILSGLLIGFLLFAISWTPVFYFMDIVTEITDVVIEGAEYEEGDPKTKLYLAVETLDEYFVGPYKESPVVKLYRNTGIIEILTNTVQQGSVIAKDQSGEPVYANQIAKLYLSRGIRLACAMMDINYSKDFIRDDMEDMTIKSPVYQNGVEMIAEFLVGYMEEHPDFADSFIKAGEEGEQDLINLFLSEVIGVYKNGVLDDDGEIIKSNKDVIKDDFNALTDVVIIASENDLISKIVLSQGQEANLLSDREFITAMIGAASKLTPYKPAMETAFTYGVGMLGEMEGLGIPKDNAEGFESFISQLVAGANNVTAINGDERAEIQNLFIAVAEHQYKQSAVEFVANRIADLEAQIAERRAVIEENESKVLELEAEIEELSNMDGLTAEEIEERNLEIMAKKDEKDELESESIAQQYVIDDLIVELEGKPAEGEEGSEDYIAAEKGYYLIRDELDEQGSQYEGTTSILDYVADPLYVVEIIFKQEGEHIEHLIQKLGDEAEAAKTQKAELEAQLNTYKNETSIEYTELLVVISALEREKEISPDTWTPELEEELKAAIARKDEIDEGVKSLEAQVRGFAQNAKNLLALKDVMTEQSEILSKTSTDYLKEAETRLNEFTPFMNYFMNWTSIQKPLLLAGEDATSAALSVYINGKLYVCNTDEISIDEIIDLAFEDLKIPGSEDGEGSVDKNEFTDMNVDDYLDQVPMREVFERIVIEEVTDKNKESYVGRVSPYTNFVNFLITLTSDHFTNDEAVEIDEAWFYDALGRYVTILSNPETHIEDRSAQLISDILKARDDKNDFDYKGITLELVVASLNFDIWDDPNSNSKVEDTEHLVEIVFAFIDLMDKLQNQEQPDAEESVPAEEGSTEIEGIGDIDALVDLFMLLGETFDLMAETECLGDLPAVMLKVILTNPMFGQIMTTSMLYHDDVDDSKDGYLVQIERIKAEFEKPLEEREKLVDENGDFVVDENGNYVYRYTYSSFTEGFVNRVRSLLDKFNNNSEGGNENA